MHNTPHQEPVGRRPRRMPPVLSMFAGILWLLAAIAICLGPGATSAQGKATLPAGASTPSSAHDNCLQTWSPVNSPQVRNSLYGVDALSSDDVWMVGAALIQHWDGAAWTVITGTEIVSGTVYDDIVAIDTDDAWAVGTRADVGAAIAHWDGSQWSRVPNPAEQPGTHLISVDAISSDDVWAVGSTGGFGSSEAFAVHWDGENWSIVDTPNPQFDTSGLYAVTAVSADDVWAVGYEIDNGVGGAIFMHWDGATWTQTTEFFENIVLFGADAISADDIWAVGIYWTGSTAPGVIFHWDGASWTQRLITEPGINLRDVEGLAQDDAWAVGASDRGTVIEHWDGTLWSRVDSPGPAYGTGELYDIAAISAEDIWAVGDTWSPSTYSVVVRYSQWCPPPVVCTPGLHVIDSPNPAASYNMLWGVDALSPEDMWAVGAFMFNDTITGTVAEHWNGSYWEVISIEDVPNASLLWDVTMISHDDVWAVGTRDIWVAGAKPGFAGRLDGRAASPDSPNQSVTAHWDGEDWTLVPSPNPGTIGMGTVLSAVSGVSANDVWAVGRYYDGSYRGLILHWDGTAWTQVANPPGTLVGVVALASNDVWAVGTTYPGLTNHTLTMHWDGFTWSTIASPSPGDSENYLNDVSAVSPNDIWAAGYSYDSLAGRRPVVLHWDGAGWTLQSETLPGNIEPIGIAAAGANNVWVVGSANWTAGLVLHWDGTTWTALPSPITDPNIVEYINGVVAVSANEVWMVGEAHQGRFVHDTLVERYIGSCETPTPTATVMATSTPTSTFTRTPVRTATATATATAINTATNTPNVTNTPAATATTGATASATATSMPVVCEIAFQDVPLGHTFYAQVRCLACLDILSGYPCGGPGEPCGPTGDPYFRPGNGVTRGQIAKIVAGAAGFVEPVSGQSFEDLPPGSSFYEVAERLFSRGVVGGYPCGSLGEPCGTGNLPYFRPNGSATRGQIAKLVAQAKQLTDPVTGQTFEDVPPSSTFYDYIGRLMALGVMNGYPCGGPGEPCIGPSNLPYFRPNGSATRGQASKIVANAFLPGCSP
jgi:hypothetical protein